MFSGVGVNQPAVAPADAILTELETALTAAGASTASDVANVVTDWFAVGGGYDTTGYVGQSASASPVRLSCRLRIGCPRRLEWLPQEELSTVKPVATKEVTDFC